MNTLVFMRRINFVHYSSEFYHYSYFILYISSSFLNKQTACLNWKLKNNCQEYLICLLYLILNIQTIFKVVLGTFGYLVVFLFFFTSARDVEHKGHCWFIFIFSTKIKFNDFIEFFFFLDKFECIYDVYTIYTNLVVSHGCEICDTFILYFS